MNEQMTKNTCAFVEPVWPGSCFLEDVSDGPWHPPYKTSILPGQSFPVPDNETGYWQFLLPGTLAHPWVTLAWHGGMEVLGLPESYPSLCQNGRSKITESCFYASAEWAHALPCQANQIPLASNCGTLSLMISTGPQYASATGQC